MADFDFFFSEYEQKNNLVRLRIPILVDRSAIRIKEKTSLGASDGVSAHLRINMVRVTVKIQWVTVIFVDLRVMVRATPQMFSG